ncbi:MAG: B12-binding domain-containing radical SAM protein [Terracidiphilus sp.]
MSVHLVNPSDNSFGTAVITPRWLFVLAAATPQTAGDPILVDESLEQIQPETIQPGDIVGISVHTGNALRGYAVGRMARSRGAWVIYGGIHATLFPEEAFERGAAHAVVTGDGDLAWGKAVVDCMAGKLERIYEGGRIEGNEFLAARWDLMDPEKYMWASVQTIRGCPKHCSFCSVWKTDGQRPRQRNFHSVVDEIVALRRLGFRFIALADDNFYPVTFTDLRLAREQGNTAKLEELTLMRAERFHLMEELAKLPKDMVFYTQMTMEAGEDVVFLDAMKKANIKGALVGIEAVTPEGLKAVYKDWNLSGDAMARQLQTFKEHGVHVLGSFIFGLPTDRPATFDATVEMALKAGVTFAQFVMMTPFPGTVDFGRWEKEQAENPTMVGDVPITRYWLIPIEVRPKMFTPHPTMSSDEIRERTQKVWDRFYNWAAIWQRSACTPNLRSRIAFMFLSKLYRQMYAGTGISTDSARRKKSKAWARWTAHQCKKLFRAKPMPELAAPEWTAGLASSIGQAAFAGGNGAELAGSFSVTTKR